MSLSRSFWLMGTYLHWCITYRLAPPRVRAPPIGQIMQFSVARSNTKHDITKIISETNLIDEFSVSIGQKLNKYQE